MEELLKEVKFDERGLAAAIIQDYRTGEVLMLAYMNREALEKSLTTGLATYWSRSRGSLWTKGETSGNFQRIKSVSLDCDGDALLLKVEQVGNACHTGYHSCFFRELYKEAGGEESRDLGLIPACQEDPAEILKELYAVIKDRMAHPREGSYTSYLFKEGLDKILKKVGEEAAEVIIAAKNRSRDETRYEIADLLYHLLVLMAEQGLSLEEIYGELKGRRK